MQIAGRRLVRALCALVVAALLASCSSSTTVTARPTEQAASPTSATPAGEPSETTDAAEQDIASAVPAATPTAPPPYQDQELDDTEIVMDVAEPDGSEEPAAVPPKASDELIYGDLPTWDQITAGRPYIDPDDAEPRDEIVLWVTPTSTKRFTIYDDGNLVDGVFERSEPVGASTWRSEAHIDLVARYAWLGTDRVLEPGDRGCDEVLETGDTGYWRSTFNVESQFAEEPGMGSAFDVLYVYDLSRDRVLEFFDAVTVIPEITIHDNGFVSYRATLVDEEAQAALREFGAHGGASRTFQVAAVEIVIDNHGTKFSTAVWARYTGDAREVAGRNWITRNSVYSHSVNTALEPGYAQRTPDQSVLESGFCRPPTDDIFGTWQWAGLAIDGSEITPGYLEQLVDGFITIKQDGSFSGSTGCQAFEGTSTIGFSALEDVATTFLGEPCTDGDFEESPFEEMVTAVLSGDMAASVNLEGRLFLVDLDDDSQAVLHYRQD